jgi:hypothetical protein
VRQKFSDCALAVVSLVLEVQNMCNDSCFICGDPIFQVGGTGFPLEMLIGRSVVPGRLYIWGALESDIVKRPDFELGFLLPWRVVVFSDLSRVGLGCDKAIRCDSVTKLV